MNNINLQLYTLGFEDRSQLTETFKTIAAMGFTGIEFSPRFMRI